MGLVVTLANATNAWIAPADTLLPKTVITSIDGITLVCMDSLYTVTHEPAVTLNGQITTRIIGWRTNPSPHHHLGINFGPSVVTMVPHHHAN